MSEKVGNVVLNYDHYSGIDLYSEGDVEDELLDIVQSNEERQFNNIIAERKKWSIMYHLSHIRGNIVEWLPISKKQTVLEIGSGCGAITGVLANKAKKVTCIELSKKRSLINAYRNRDKENIEILLGNFEEVERDIIEKYDYITLIGVFEYSESYILQKKPYVNFLNIIRKHLKNNGKVIIAIENKLGLKYWAGCKEDHVDRYFENIEDYTKTKGVKTFSRKELEEIMQESGFYNYKFYYPYPDYKLPTQIYSDSYLPKRGELNNNNRNFDKERIVTFDESKVYDTIIKEGLFPVYSNSYLIVIDEQGECK
ncbi:MAG: class I SAM-dependent methyltransferase [Clostridium beijerinckii]|nr:class I SAM-dependent methyltransferase [Clostridium beijerinckii]